MSHIKLSQKNYEYNLNQLCSYIQNDKNKLSVVLKDNAYEHGLDLIAALASDFGINKAIVRNTAEATSIKKYFKDIIILNDYNTKKTDFIYSINDINDFTKIKNNRLAIKINSGMNRNGIKPNELESALKLSLKHGSPIHSIFTHFSSADDLNGNFQWQLQEWKKIKQQAILLCKSLNIPTPLFHSANSSTLIRSGTEDDFARCGIATYGYSEIDQTLNPPKLKPVLSLYADKTSTTSLNKGDKVGYSATFTAKEKMKISTYDIGYGDGLFRLDGSNNLKTASNEQILGIVSMDYISVESEKDSICIFNDASIWAKRFNTISYDILVKLSQNIKRDVIWD